MTANKYRDRIYGSYVSSQETVTGLPTAQNRFAPRAALLYGVIDEHFPRDLEAKILDLGCGHGALLWFAQAKGFRNTKGIDVSLEQVELAEQLGVHNVVQGDIGSALSTEPKEQLDVVVMFDVLEHFTRDELIVVMDGVFRVLKPGGRLIAHVPNGASPFVGRIRYGDFTHELAFTRTSLRQLALSSGFSRVDCFEDNPFSKSIRGVLRSSLWRFFRSLMRLYLAAETGDIHRDGIFTQNLLAVVYK